MPQNADEYYLQNPDLSPAGQMDPFQPDPFAVPPGGPQGNAFNPSQIQSQPGSPRANDLQTTIDVLQAQFGLRKNPTRLPQPSPATLGLSAMLLR